MENFRDFRCEIMNVSFNYDDDVKKVNTTNSISVVEVEEENMETKVSQKLTYSCSFRTVSRQKNSYDHSPQYFVASHKGETLIQKSTTRKMSQKEQYQ